MTRCTAFGAGSESTFAGHAEFNLFQTIGVAALAHDLDGITGQSWIDAAELFDQIAWCDQQRFRRRAEHFRDLDVSVSDARRLKIGRCIQARAGAMLLVLMDDQPAAWHDVHHAVDHAGWHIRLAACSAELGPAALILWPKTVHDKTVGFRAAWAALGIVGTAAVVGAMRRAPTEHELVVVELAGDMLSATVVAGTALRVGRRHTGDLRGETCSRKNGGNCKTLHNVILPRSLAPRRPSSRDVALAPMDHPKRAKPLLAQIMWRCHGLRF